MDLRAENHAREAKPTWRFVRGVCSAENLHTLAGETDLVVVPLALRGCKAEFYRTPPAAHVLIHDWLWRRGDSSIVVSLALLKRLNLVKQ